MQCVVHFFQCVQPMLHGKDNNMMRKTYQMLFITKEEVSTFNNIELLALDTKVVEQTF